MSVNGLVERQKGTVLVVDDSAVVRAIVTNCLRQAGYTVDEASDGANALERLHAATYDVIVTDLHMPKHDGFELLEKVKQGGLCTEIVILTGEHAEDMSAALRALRLGAHDYLRKPSRPEEIVLTVMHAAEKKRLREANARMVQELELQSRTDGLTGLWNRRAFDEALAVETARAERYNLSLALIMFDLDHFKDVNDAFGHPVGDAVLQRVARIALRVVRKVDALYRYGGEEFAVLLPQTRVEGALVSASRLVTLVSQTVMTFETAELQLTVSAGVAAAQGSQRDYDGLVALADAALYRAKQAGRNRVVAIRSPVPKSPGRQTARCRTLEPTAAAPDPARPGEMRVPR